MKTNMGRKDLLLYLKIYESYASPFYTRGVEYYVLLYVYAHNDKNECIRVYVLYKGPYFKLIFNRLVKEIFSLK